jgi:hypothetical protein
VGATVRRWLFLIPLLFALQAEAATYWVSQSGNDGNQHCVNSATQPALASTSRTINQGISCLTTAGDTLMIGPGTYNENVVIGGGYSHQNFPSGSSFSNPVTIKAITPGTVILLPTSFANLGTVFDVMNVSHNNGVTYSYGVVQDIIFDGSNQGGGSSVIDAGGVHWKWINVEARNSAINNSANAPGAGAFIDGDDNQFIGCNMHHNGANWNASFFDGNQAPYGFYAHSTNMLITHCLIHDNAGNGTQFYTQDPYSNDGSVFSYNTVYDNGYNFPITASGFTGPAQYHGGTAVRVFGNLFYWTRGYSSATHKATVTGLDVHNNAVVYNNTVVGYPEGGITDGSSSFNGIMTNNIAWQNSVTPTYSSYANFGSGLGGGTVSNNGCSAAVTGCALLSTNPFVNQAGSNFHLTGLPNGAINTGNANLAYCAQVDIDGTARPQQTTCDMGAFEFIQTLPLPTVTINLPVGCVGTVNACTIQGAVVNLSGSSSLQ